jgi:hypothetical protein
MGAEGKASKIFSGFKVEVTPSPTNQSHAQANSKRINAYTAERQALLASRGLPCDLELSYEVRCYRCRCLVRGTITPAADGEPVELEFEPHRQIKTAVIDRYEVICQTCDEQLKQMLNGPPLS